MKKSWLDDRTIVITGASSGIGKELAKLLILKHNCHIIAVGRSEEKIKSVMSELGTKKNNFEYYLFDVSIEDNWRQFAEKCKDKNIDCIINNAGMLPEFSSIDTLVKSKDKLSIVTAEVDSIINVNYMSVIYGTVFTPLIEKSSSPAIINIASSAGLCAIAGTAIYSASKAAVKNFTECLACEKKYYIGLVCPGFTKTDIFRNQKYKSDNKLISMISSSVVKMSKKIYKGIRKKKRRIVAGFDAKFMDWLYRFMPSLAGRFFSKILKKSKCELFTNVFNYKEIRK